MGNIDYAIVILLFVIIFLVVYTQLSSGQTENFDVDAERQKVINRLRIIADAESATIASSADKSKQDITNVATHHTNDMNNLNTSYKADFATTLATKENQLKNSVSSKTDDITSGIGISSLIDNIDVQNINIGPIDEGVSPFARIADLASYSAKKFKYHDNGTQWGHYRGFGIAEPSTREYLTEAQLSNDADVDKHARYAAQQLEYLDIRIISGNEDPQQYLHDLIWRCQPDRNCQAVVNTPAPRSGSWGEWAERSDVRGLVDKGDLYRKKRSNILYKEPAALVYAKLTKGDGSGITISASSGHDTMLNAFDAETESGWHSNSYEYDRTDRAYLGGKSTLVDGKMIKGAWLQIKFGYPIRLESHVIRLEEDYRTKHCPSSFTLVHSDDGVNWSVLQNKKNVYYKDRVKRFKNMKSLTQMRYLRLIITQVGNYDATSDKPVKSEYAGCKISNWDIVGWPLSEIHGPFRFDPDASSSGNRLLSNYRFEIRDYSEKYKYETLWYIIETGHVLENGRRTWWIQSVDDGNYIAHHTDYHKNDKYLKPWNDGLIKYNTTGQWTIEHVDLDKSNNGPRYVIKNARFQNKMWNAEHHIISYQPVTDARLTSPNSKWRIYNTTQDSGGDAIHTHLHQTNISTLLGSNPAAEAAAKKQAEEEEAARLAEIEEEERRQALIEEAAIKAAEDMEKARAESAAQKLIDDAAAAEAEAKAAAEEEARLAYLYETIDPLDLDDGLSPTDTTAVTNDTVVYDSPLVYGDDPMAGVGDLRLDNLDFM